MNPDQDPKKVKSPSAETLGQEFFAAYHRALHDFPDKISEKVSGAFSKSDILPGPLVQDLVEFFGALIREKAQNIFYEDASAALQDGTLGQLFRETLDHDLLLQASARLIGNSLADGLWFGSKHAHYSFFFESAELITGLGRNKSNDSFWSAPQQDNDLVDYLAAHYSEIESEFLDRARHLPTTQVFRDIEGVINFLDQSSLFGEYINSHHSEFSLYVSPLGYGEMFYGTIAVFHTNAQNRGSRIGSDIALVSQALSVGLKHLLDVAKYSHDI